MKAAPEDPRRSNNHSNTSYRNYRVIHVGLVNRKCCWKDEEYAYEGCKLTENELGERKIRKNKLRGLWR